MIISKYPRKNTKTVNLGGVLIGGGHPVSIQSMTNTKTKDAEATIGQINELAALGCQIVRLAVPDQEAADKLPDIIKASPVPLVADIHFDYRLALASIKSGIHGLRLNPGNIGSQMRVREVAKAAKDKGIPIRIGVNGGSLEKDILTKYGGVSAQAMVESALSHVQMLEEEGFEDIKISLKSSDLQVMIEAYRIISGISPYPLHLGLTEAGTVRRGSIRSAVAIGTLLAEGIGDTIRVSLTGDPRAEITVAKEILRSLGYLEEGFIFISCPTCGRTDIDVEGIALEVEERLSLLKPPHPMRIAVMGCVVNGPGEAREADFGIAGGKQEGLLFCKGQAVGKFKNDELADALIEKVIESIKETNETKEDLTDESN